MSSLILSLEVKESLQFIQPYSYVFKLFMRFFMYNFDQQIQTDTTSVKVEEKIMATKETPHSEDFLN